MMMEMIKEGMDQSIWPNFIQYSMKSKRKFSAKDKKQVLMIENVYDEILFY